MMTSSNRPALSKFISAALVISVLTLAMIATISLRTSANSDSGKISTLTFHDQMRKLWEDHITWTRLVITGFTFNNPDFNASLTRLLQNQQDLGNAIKPFYGDEAGNKLSSLLTAHILIAAQILTAAKAGNQEALNDSLTRWYENANDIAAFLSGLNPKFLPFDQVKALMKMHLNLTFQEAATELSGDYNGSVFAYDHVHLEILLMADTLSSAIINQFPGMFTGPST